LEKESKWQKFKSWLKSPQGKKTIPIILIVLVVLGFLGYTIYSRYFKKDIPQEEQKEVFVGKEEKKEKCALDGLMYEPEDANRHPLAIIVENHTQSRPHTGLNDATIVYEAIAEGGITRFLAIYGPKVPDKVGPVRSARTYYLDWTLEYDAFFAHVGGNMDALDQIPNIGIKDLDQFSIGKEAYWRESRGGRATEHTMYTNPQKLYEVAKKKGWETEKFNLTSLEFKQELVQDERPESQIIKINFSTDPYNVTWKYDRESNNYLRSMGSTAHKDELSGEQIKTKNIIVQTVERTPTTTRINESGYNMKTVGEGKAKIFLDGTEIHGTWKKTNQKSRTLFYDEQGKQIKFNPGNFWYEIIPPESTVTITES